MGVIEIVPNANTVAKIQKEGAGLIRGAFKDEVLVKWLERKNPDPAVLKSAVETFMRSCAGYCVATYVLGRCDHQLVTKAILDVFSLIAASGQLILTLFVSQVPTYSFFHTSAYKNFYRPQESEIGTTTTSW